jgi:aminopeptidase N
MKTIPKDPHSYADPNEAIVRHIDLDLDAKFKSRRIIGTADLRFERAASAQRIILDTKDLQIKKVTGEDGSALDFQLGERDNILGSALIIELPEKGNKIEVAYETTPSAEALQWLDKEQTADKKMPFLFTQSQAILARSWIPLQDSPGVRFTYSASVQVPEGMLALMSAENPQEMNTEGVYQFNMPQPIPSYLMALAVGNIEFAGIGQRTGVYAEPGMLQKSREEFSEMDEMLRIAEELYGDYRWGRYDLIVLPPSFPYGGMENPRLTFATPTILAGDKSLTSLVAHELAHSWSGNLVTNATWNDFWLNEGFTVYFEYRIMEALKGRDYSEMLAALSLQGLKAEVDQFMGSGKENATKLKLDLKGKNPDDGMNTIAYDKGYFFLRRLEEYVGRETFDAFLNRYFEEHAFQSNDTDAFVAYLKTNLFEKQNVEPIDDLQEWIYGTGLPESMPEVTAGRFKEVDMALEKWRDGDNDFDTSGWSTHEWVHFITNLPVELTENEIADLDARFGITESGNAEILGVWFVHCARQLLQPSFVPMDSFLVNTGRRKFLMPIFKELIKTETGRKLAEEIYRKARPNYHFVATNSLDELLGKQKDITGR